MAKGNNMAVANKEILQAATAGGRGAMRRAIRAFRAKLRQTSNSAPWASRSVPTPALTLLMASCPRKMTIPIKPTPTSMTRVRVIFSSRLPKCTTGKVASSIAPMKIPARLLSSWVCAWAIRKNSRNLFTTARTVRISHCQMGWAGYGPGGGTRRIAAPPPPPCAPG